MEHMVKRGPYGRPLELTIYTCVQKLCLEVNYHDRSIY